MAHYKQLTELTLPKFHILSYDQENDNFCVTYTHAHTAWPSSCCRCKSDSRQISTVKNKYKCSYMRRRILSLSFKSISCWRSTATVYSANSKKENKFPRQQVLQFDLLTFFEHSAFVHLSAGEKSELSQCLNQQNVFRGQ